MVGYGFGGEDGFAYVTGGIDVGWHDSGAAPSDVGGHVLTGYIAVAGEAVVDGAFVDKLGESLLEGGVDVILAEELGELLDVACPHACGPHFGCALDDLEGEVLHVEEDHGLVGLPDGAGHGDLLVEKLDGRYHAVVGLIDVDDLPDDGDDAAHFVEEAGIFGAYTFTILIDEVFAARLGIVRIVDDALEALRDAMVLLLAKELLGRLLQIVLEALVREVAIWIEIQEHHGVLLHFVAEEDELVLADKQLVALEF